MFLMFKPPSNSAFFPYSSRLYSLSVIHHYYPIYVFQNQRSDCRTATTPIIYGNIQNLLATLKKGRISRLSKIKDILLGCGAIL